MVSCSIAGRNFYRKHVVFLILLRRLLYSENLNSPTAQTVSLSLYAMLAKLRNPAYCLLAEISACNGARYHLDYISFSHKTIFPVFNVSGILIKRWFSEPRNTRFRFFCASMNGPSTRTSI